MSQFGAELRAFDILVAAQTTGVVSGDEEHVWVTQHGRDKWSGRIKDLSAVGPGQDLAPRGDTLPTAAAMVPQGDGTGRADADGRRMGTVPPPANPRPQGLVRDMDVSGSRNGTDMSISGSEDEASGDAPPPRHGRRTRDPTLLRGRRRIGGR